MENCITEIYLVTPTKGELYDIYWVYVEENYSRIYFDTNLELYKTPVDLSKDDALDVIKGLGYNEYIKRKRFKNKVSKEFIIQEEFHLIGAL